MGDVARADIGTVATGNTAPPPARAMRILRLIACVPIGLLLAAVLIFGAARLGLLDRFFGPVVHGDMAYARSQSPGTRVLFIGNSFTSFNSMPQLVQQLVDDEPGAPRIVVVSYTEDGSTWQQASRERKLTDLIAEVHWDDVVLQEQSELQSFSAFQRAVASDPFAADLSRRATAAGARTVLFMTWGYRQGDRDNVPSDTYSAMQARLQQGYDGLGAKLYAPVAPVGLAWQEALRRRPGLPLWADDGRHPSLLGSYLAACVFTATLTGLNPTASGFTAGLDPAEARWLQQVAWNVAG